MGKLTALDNIIQAAKASAAELSAATAPDGTAPGPAGLPAPDGAPDHMLIRGDNNAVMRQLLAGGYGGAFQCIYLDPPFLSGADYQATVKIRSEKCDEELAIKVPAYQDTWTAGKGRSGSEEGHEAYYKMLAENLVLARQLLADTGLLWLHLDWHTVHYARVMLDEIFGEERFLNEIIWQYKSGGSTKKHFARKHDTILVYAKTADYRIHIDKEKSYNRGLKPYRFKGVEEFEDETGWYTLVNAKDVWQIDMVGRTSAERNGYATQKPLALMERIVKASSEVGDLIGDFCCGSGGFLEAGAKLGRRTAGCDRSMLAAALAEKRLLDGGYPYQRYEIEESLPEGSTDTSKAGSNNLIDGLKPADRKTLQRIEREDPQALVLFETQAADGNKRVVDVFGRETITNGTED